jgi:hypothetical protein
VPPKDITFENPNLKMNQISLISNEDLLVIGRQTSGKATDTAHYF